MKKSMEEYRKKSMVYSIHIGIPIKGDCFHLRLVGFIHVCLLCVYVFMDVGIVAWPLGIGAS